MFLSCKNHYLYLTKAFITGGGGIQLSVISVTNIILHMIFHCKGGNWCLTVSQVIFSKLRFSCETLKMKKYKGGKHKNLLIEKIKIQLVQSK